MSRGWAAFLLGVALALLAGWGLWTWLGGSLSHGRVAAGVAVPVGEPARFQLYFPTDGGMIKAEARDLRVLDEPRDRVRKLVAALLEGPKTPGLLPPFPQGVTAGTVAISKDGIAYVDLRWDGHADPPSSGSTEESQRLFSIVDTVAMNVPEATRVVLLWNGFQRESFAGHLDTSRPLSPDRSIVAP
jgi:hypothetical protein